METIFAYIAKSAGLIIMFYYAYYLLLRKETFFNSNRWFLLAGLITSTLLPFFVYTKVIWVKADPVSDLNLISDNTISTSGNGSVEITWIYLILSIYCIGFLALLIKLAMDFYSLNSILKGKKIHKQGDFKFIDAKENIAPFSYFQYIVFNSSLYTKSELENIIEHEKVHSDQNHTVDVLISRVFCLLFWFNPIVWLYKKAIIQNLEFIADKEAAQKISDKKAYQYTLLKITTHKNCVAITNHFYQSLIKKRIVMLNKNQSKKKNSWKYYVVIPALIAFVFLFQIEVIAKEKQQVLQEVSEEIKSVDVYKIKKTSTDADLKEIKEKLKSIHNIDFTASDIKRNSENNLTSIKIDLKNGTQQTQSIQTAGESTIKDFGVSVITDNDGNKKIGIDTSTEEITSKKDKDSKKIISKKLTTKQSTNAKINSDTNAKTDSNINTNTNVVVSTNDKENTNVVISSTVQPNVKIGYNQLIIVNGEIVPNTIIEDLESLNIKSMSIFKGIDALAKYGDKGKNGVIVIETKN